jgi:hypothetical protein
MLPLGVPFARRALGPVGGGLGLAVIFDLEGV